MKIEIRLCGDCPFYDGCTSSFCFHPKKPEGVIDVQSDDCPDWCPLRIEDTILTFGNVEGEDLPRYMNGSYK